MTSPTVQQSVRFEQRADLASLFSTLLTSDLGVSDLADKLGHENTRYTRELLGMLMGADLAIVFESPDGDLYTAKSWDEDDQAWAAFNDRYPEPAVAPAKSSAPQTPRDATLPDGAPAPAEGKRGKTPTPCLCGCGDLTASNYRPGHDARHAGQIAKRMASEFERDPINMVLLAALPSEKLQEKALKMATRLIDKTRAGKPERKAEMEAAMEVADTMEEAAEEITGMELESAEEAAGQAPDPVAEVQMDAGGNLTAEAPQEEWTYGYIKQGRYSYRARRSPQGATERNSNRAGTGPWSAANAIDVQNFKEDK